MLLADFLSQGMVFKYPDITHTHTAHLFVLSISSPRLRGGSSPVVVEGKDVYEMQCPCMSHSVNMFPRLHKSHEEKKYSEENQSDPGFFLYVLIICSIKTDVCVCGRVKSRMRGPAVVLLSSEGSLLSVRQVQLQPDQPTATSVDTHHAAPPAGAPMSWCSPHPYINLFRPLNKEGDCVPQSWSGVIPPTIFMMFHS